MLLNFKKNFDGRARRKEYWMFWTMSWVVLTAFYTIYTVIAIIISGLTSMLYSLLPYSIALVIISILGGINSMIIGGLSLIILVPFIAVTIRRLHDIGKSGWSLLLGLVPIIGSIIVFLWTCQPGQTGANEYGLDPKDTPETTDNADNNNKLLN